MFGISKRGNRYLRRLLIHGARSCVMHLDRSRDRLGAWLRQLHSRMHVNKVTVAWRPNCAHRLGGSESAWCYLLAARSRARLERVGQRLRGSRRMRRQSIGVS